MLRRLILSVFLMVTLVACGSKATTVIPTGTAVVKPATVTPSSTSTFTAIPPTSTVTPTPTFTPTPTLTPLPVSYGPENFPADINPLTGLQVVDAAVLNRRPFGVKVNIVPRGLARPPWGLSFADLVFDYYHNSGYTRYHVVFYGENPEQVGPIRSGRLLDDSLIRMYKSIFVYGGADNRIDRVFWGSDYSGRLIIGGFDNIPCPPTVDNPLCTFDPKGVHNLIANVQMLRSYVEKKGIDNTRPNLDGMYFWIMTPEGGKDGKQLSMRFSSDNYNRWDYDSVSGRYLLFQDNEWDQGKGERFAPLIDRVTNLQIGADNVVVLIAPHEYFIPPSSGSEGIIDILLTGSGPAYAFRDGKAYEVVWNRPAMDSVLYLTFPDGTRFPYKPGKTWYQIINTTSKIVQNEDSSWRFEFHIPQY